MFLVQKILKYLIIFVSILLKIEQYLSDKITNLKLVLKGTDKKLKIEELQENPPG
jgi:hypothetical protein